jgi:iron(III) transport system ATP-binding protein
MLTIDNLTLRFGATTAVDGVSLNVRRGEVVCLLGPSGSGKSTLLRAIAGIERPTGGRILIDGVEVSGPATFIEPEDRHVGMVFQDYALFPHLTVTANVAFGLRRDRSAVPVLIERLGLGRLASSYPHMLSGGERQRVALARAMAPKPRILLMDEPFSSLDSRLRDDVRRHTIDFVRESGTTTVIVTHDPDEAMRIADRVALLDAGRLVQFGTPEELYSQPATLFAARFFSDVAALPGVCRDGFVETRLGRFGAGKVPAGRDALVCLRPQHLRLAAAPTGIEGRVVGAEYRGDCRHVLVAVDGIGPPVTVCVQQRDTGRLQTLAPGAVVHLDVDSDDVPVVAAGNEGGPERGGVALVDRIEPGSTDSALARRQRGSSDNTYNKESSDAQRRSA